LIDFKWLRLYQFDVISFKLTELVTLKTTQFVLILLKKEVGYLMKKINIPLKLQVITAIWILLFSFSVLSQSAGTDTLETGRTYYEGNFWSGTQSHENGGMQIYGGRFAYGLSKNVEAGLGASFSDPNDPEYPPEIQPNIKWKFYENESKGIAAAGGAIAYIPIARRTGTDAFVMVYSNVSKEIKPLNDAKITVGGYALVGRNRSFGSRKGLNLMYEQPLMRKISFSTQWVSGKNRFGYLTAGFSLAATKKSSLFLGYSVGNYDYDNHGPYISYGIYW
jgi:hypothetical protein